MERQGSPRLLTHATQAVYVCQGHKQQTLLMAPRGKYVLKAITAQEGRLKKYHALLALMGQALAWRAKANAKTVLLGDTVLSTE